MTGELCILDLKDVVAILKEVTEPYSLGIQLSIDTSILKKIERDHPGKIDRQKTEVIEYWLHNSSDASWKSLTDAAEGMGGHARLVETLKERRNKVVRNHHSQQRYKSSHIKNCLHKT